MFKHALEDCLTRMRLEGAIPEECLAKYPQFRHELAPLLFAAQSLGALEALEPRPEFRAQTRAKLHAHMRVKQRRQPIWFNALAFRYAASLALVFVMFTATGTALAQNALPGDTLFGWKLASEKIWYDLHGNSLEADIYLTDRRVSEIEAIQGMGNLEEIGVDAYSAVLQQLSQDLANNPEESGTVGELLRHQRQRLTDIVEQSTGNLPTLDALFGIVILPENAASPAQENAHTPIENPGGPSKKSTPE